MGPISSMRTDCFSQRRSLNRAITTLLCASGLLLFDGCATPLSTQPQPTAPSVVAAIEFVGTNLIGAAPNPQLADWWNLKLKIGSDAPDAYFFLISTNDQSERIHVETCQQYTNAINKGAYAPTTADMAMDSWFVRAVAVLKFMEKAQPSQHLLPDDFLNRLPVSFVGWNGSDEEAQLNRDTIRGVTLKDYVRSKRVAKFKAQNHSLHFQTDAKNFAVEELACGDWDGDGFEDALVFITWHYRGGSGVGYELYVVKRSTTGSSVQLNPFAPR